MSGRWMPALLALAFLPAVAQNQPQYLGCFTDQPKRDLDGLQTHAAGPAACTATCTAKGFKYAAMQAGTFCFCGNSYGRYGISNGCRACPGDSSQNCGGSYANAVWSLAGSSPAPPPSPPPKPVASPTSAAASPALGGAWKFLGCFTDKPQRDLDGLQTSANGPAACTALCAARGFPFAAMQAGNYCFCGKTYGRYGASNECRPCRDDPSQSCGGSYANAVWGLSGTAQSVPAPAQPGSSSSPRSLTGAWVHSSDQNAQTPNSKVIITQDGMRVTLTQSYKMEATRNLWLTIVCSGTLSGNDVNLVCDWAPGGNPLGFAGGSRMSMRLSADGNHLDGTLSGPQGVQGSHYSRIP
ncbi:MAG: WSC domain-containing protein [Acidobacteria bacterium]|nr:WSC domain-containing protein [Acidobacteriota bacterium]